MTTSWQFWIDRGGTFTDCVGLDSRTGELRVVKVLSSDCAPLVAIRKVLGLGEAESIPACDVRMGTTLATNALLERKGARTALVVTQGLGDLLEIGDQTRPDLFALDIRKPARIYTDVLEVDARADAAGRTIARPDLATLRADLEAIHERGVRSLAVVVLHAYRAGELEREIGDAARRAGFEHVALSHEVANEIGIVGRGDTTVVDAYLTPLLRDYVETLRAALPGTSLEIMQSSGGLADASRFRGKNAILSGPAAGAVACAHVASERGLAQVIGLDMGGTSTDVSRCELGRGLERVYETTVAGVRVRAPMMAIHTVAAGGGSICRLDGSRLTVGPDSAGAFPGPLCYGRPEATALTLTDVDLVLGRLAADRFPFPLDEARPRAALRAIAADLGSTEEEVAAGFFRVATESMAQAIRKVSVLRGHDVREHALVVFGGAGGQHACALARRLGIRTIVMHPLAGVLSAFGMGVADVTWHGEGDAGRTVLDDARVAAIARSCDELEARGRAELSAVRPIGESARVSCFVDVRYAGTESALSVPFVRGRDDAAALAHAFEALHERELGYVRPGHPIEATAVRVEVAAAHAPVRVRAAASPAAPRATIERTTRMWARGRTHERVRTIDRESLQPGDRAAGPLLVLEETGTIAVDPGFELACDEDGVLVITDVSRESPRDAGAPSAPERADPVHLEIFASLFMSIAEQMGSVLRRTALSTNIRDRLDFSCAVFDREGGLVANAPHIPVHLGAMSESVRAVIASHPRLAPGDVFATNDPAMGGSHLPDITVVTPVHGEDGRLAFFTASRGHHADIGGTTPGSMPPDSRTLEEEGVVLRALPIVRAGRFDEGALRAALAGARFPARKPDDNVADIVAQIAANRAGAHLLREAVERYGVDKVEAYMQHVQDDAAERVAEAIDRIADGEHRFEDTLDDGSAIRVTLRVRGREMVVDFDGTAPESASNLNAPRAVTIAAVLYVLRTLVGRPIPLNSGCLRHVEVRVPDRSLLAPGPSCAVAAGNVETSQRIVDVLLGALGRVAASQGTMNNLTFGDESFGYYETIGGGAGAGDGFDGASGVHTHMTNTRATDPEVLEARFAVRLIEFSLRRGSGGAGRFRGGDGLVRELELLSPMRVSILSERRDRAPFGLAGGEPGARGRNLHNGRVLPGRTTVAARAGDRIRIETPGGGGFGST